jgi:trans-aconitate 2-methyltransferase
MTWNPDQYLRFAGPRLRPAVDLLARVGHQPRRIVDLGCGAGNVTRLLCERWPTAEVTGVDDAEPMLSKARRELPAVRWQCRSIADWVTDGPDAAPDLLFSNAALHWLPDHSRLLPRLVALVAPGGWLAVQMPRNFRAPSHVAIADTVRAGPWRARLEGLLRPEPVAAPADYWDWLQPHAQDLDVWETEYLHALTGEDPVVEWTKGTWLAPLLDALDDAQRAAFVRDYAARLRAAYPPRGDGTTLFPFRRLFFVLRRRGGAAA